MNKPKQSPMDAILGKPGSDPKCNRFIHWFAAGAGKCLCGQMTKQPRKKKAKP